MIHELSLQYFQKARHFIFEVIQFVKQKPNYNYIIRGVFVMVDVVLINVNLINVILKYKLYFSHLY